MIGDPDAAAFLALGAAIVVLLAALAIAWARAMVAIALMLAVLGAALAASFLALDAPGPALVVAIVCAAFVPLLFVGAVLLTSPVVRAEKGFVRPSALIGALAVGAALIWTAADLPAFGGGGEDIGRIYVNSALHEVGARNAVAIVGGGYRAIDSLAVVAALIAAALGAHALLGFGERAGRAAAKDDEA